MIRDAFIIMKKELKNIFRDKKTIFSVLILPMLVYPILFGVIGFVQKMQTEKYERTEYSIYYEGDEKLLEEIKPILENVIAFELIKGIDYEALQNSRDNIGLVLKKDDGKISINIIYNPIYESTSFAVSAIKDRLNEYNRSLVSKELENMGILLSDLDKILLSEETVGKEKDQAASAKFLATLVPYFLIIFSFAGAMGIGLDITAGEKERGSLSIMLVNQVSRSSIALGKILYLMLITVIGSALNIVGLVIGFAIQFKFLDVEGMSINVLGADKILLALLVVISMSLLTGAIIVLVGSYARSVKEAGGYVTPIYMVVLLVGVSTMTAEGSKQLYHYLIPFLGSVFALKDIFLENVNFLKVSANILSSIGFTALFVFLTQKVFNSEKVLEVISE